MHTLDSHFICQARFLIDHSKTISQSVELFACVSFPAILFATWFRLIQGFKGETGEGRAREGPRVPGIPARHAGRRRRVWARPPRQDGPQYRPGHRLQQQPQELHTWAWRWGTAHCAALGGVGMRSYLAVKPAFVWRAGCRCVRVRAQYTAREDLKTIGKGNTARTHVASTVVMHRFAQSENASRWNRRWRCAFGSSLLQWPSPGIRPADQPGLPDGKAQALALAFT